MKSGSVIVDMAASRWVATSSCRRRARRRIGQRRDRHRARQPAGLDAGRCIRVLRPHLSALLLGMVRDGTLNLDFENEVTNATVIAQGGAVVSEPSRSCSAARPAGRRPRVSQRRTPHLAGHLHAGHPRRLRGHQQGPCDLLHHSARRRAPTSSTSSSSPPDRHPHRRRGGQPGSATLLASSSPWNFRGQMHVVGATSSSTWMPRMFTKKLTAPYVTSRAAPLRSRRLSQGARRCHRQWDPPSIIVDPPGWRCSSAFGLGPSIG